MQLKTFCPYNVGDYYITANTGNPTGLWPNTSWEQIQGKFLFASDATRSAGDTGGSEAVTLTADQIPSHSHSVGAHAHGLNSHTHTINHGHGFTQPTVNGGAVTNGISGGDHTHTYNDISAQASTKYVPDGSFRGDKSTNTGGTGAHKHNLPAHTHSVSGGAVSSHSGNSGTPSTANTANSAAFDSGAAGGGRLTATCRRTSRSTCGSGSRRARRRNALLIREVA